MDLSINWLKTLVDIDVDPREFSDKMTMSGTKVESYKIEGENIKNVVVGEVLSVKPHNDAKKLVVCMVDIGKSEPLQIVAGADNMVEKDLVPVAVDNSTIADGTIITKGELRGVISNGMLCSLSELNLKQEDFPYADADGIFVIKEKNAKPGDDIKDVLGLNDISVEFEITSNRPDCNSVIGLAREVSATYKNKPLKLHSPTIKGTDGDVSEYLQVEVLNESLCNRYIAKVIKNVKIAPSPRWMRERLRNSGVRPINNLVDITNYVMLEYGQPMHAFDYAHVEGKKITIRNATKDEIFTTLDDQELKLEEQMLVIADDKKPIALAGIMGGKNSGIEKTTEVVVFESAHFNYSSVRKTSKKTGIQSESSLRFSKDTDEEACLPALLRACELVELLGAGEVVNGIINVDNYKQEKNTIELDVPWINKFIGINLSKEDMEKILLNLDFKVDNGIVTVPTHRKDVSHKADLSEEIARFYGYDKIDATVMRGTADGKFTKEQIFESKVRDTLISCGGREVLTYSFISQKEYDKILLDKDSEKRNSIKISNPLGEDTSIMRTTSIPSLLGILERNYKNRNLDFSVFEIATEYIPTTKNVLPIERKKIVMGMYGENVDFYSIKGNVESLLKELKINNSEILNYSEDSTYHPGRCGKLTINGADAGILGEVHPNVLENYGIKTKTYIAEIDFDLLFQNANKNIEYEELPKYPSTSRDLAFVADKSVAMLDIKKVLEKHFSDILENIKLFDIYEGENLGENKKSLAFNITLRAKNHTLKDDEVNIRVNTAIKELENMDIYLRS